MSSRGWESVTPADIARMQHKQAPAKRSKYGNRKKQVNGETFDSSKEADHWLFLQARATAGEIRNLRRQVSFPLFAPTPTIGQNLAVGAYICDFSYWDTQDSREHIVDVKSPATAANSLYRWKKRHFEIQSGQTIEEV